MAGLQTNILFFLSALGAFNGLILSAYLFTLRKKDLAYLFLSGLLLVISIRVGKSVLFYFAPDLDKLVLQIGLSACFFIGPFLYLYLASCRKKLAKNQLSWQLHLGLIALITLIFGWFYPYSLYPELWQRPVIKVIYWSWFGYLLLALPSFMEICRSTEFSISKIKQAELLAVSVYVGVSLIWFAYAFASYTSYISGALSFSFGLYLSLLLMFWHFRRHKGNKYIDKKIESDIAQNLFSQLQEMMAEQECFRDPNLTLGQLAAKLKIPPAQLSQLLNDNVGTSFSSYVNELRVSAAKQILREDQRLNMENIAEQCGYNSVSTFYAAFKKVEQIPPAQYRKKHALFS